MKRIVALFRRLGVGMCCFSLAAVFITALNAASAAEIFVSASGNDQNAGTLDAPFATLLRAQTAARLARGHGPMTVWVRGGIYYLADTLVFTAADSGTAQSPVVFKTWQNERAIISGGRKLDLNWKPFRDGIMEAKVLEGVVTDQLFVNGERQVMARYPNYDLKVNIFNGFAPNAIGPERASRWADPRGGFIHAMHADLWGSFDYIITGKDANGDVAYEGGWQNNRPSAMHKEYRFVENIFEELDAPGEWYLDQTNSTLYHYPRAGIDLNTATIEAVRLRQLVEFRGTESNPALFITLRGFTFRHAARTFMQTKEPLLRSDWTIYRGGAVMFDGAENCAVEDCDFDQVGGNSIFVNNYNRHVSIKGCLIHDSGASGVCFVGDPKAVRSPLFKYGDTQSIDKMDKEPGPQSPNEPADCLVEDCLITGIGRVEKQATGVEISMARDITVRHCSIYEVPRAGINIGDGCWGGNVIEFCDVFDTVLETGDHGCFNSWGRDRYWNLQGVADEDKPRTALLDCVKPNIIRNSRWRCDHGWDIDLDDGSSNYEIRDNLCLNGGIKLREGYYRVCENNIMVNNSFHPHVWFRNSQDIFRHNIVFTEFLLFQVRQPWGRECDFNLLHTAGHFDPVAAVAIQKQSGADEHSLEADAMFIDPATGDYRVKDESPALKLGFKNFPMDQFGVVSPKLRAIARTPALELKKPILSLPATRDLPNRKSVIADSPAKSIQTLPATSGF